jgi:hypothetical protein
MKIATLLSSAMLVAVFAAGRAALSETVKIQSTDAVEGKCNESGGVWFPKSSTSSTYGCMNGDGHGIVCGGVGKDPKGRPYSQTCDTFIKLPPRLPTRTEIMKFEKGLTASTQPK